ncbi:MAG: hypothetical protein ACFFDQ_04620, partial [Candidatus Thorarchaeota archaeon]
MSTKKLFLKIDACYGERVRKALLEHNLLDTDYKIFSQDGALIIPLRQGLKDEILEGILGPIDYETGEMEFELISRSPKSLAEALENYLTPEELELVPRSYDLIGDIAVLEIPDELSKYKEMIGRAFHDVHRNFSTVLSKKGAVSGTTRIRDYQYLSGEDKTDTIHI